MTRNDNAVVSGEDIARIVSKIEHAVTGESVDGIGAACILVSMIINKPDAGLPVLIAGVKQFSSDILDYLYPETQEPEVKDVIVSC